MMPFLLAAAAVAALPAGSADADVRCMAAYLIATGNAKGDAAISAEDKAGVQSIFMYFFGKVDARRPGADLRKEIFGLVQSQDYTSKTLGPDIERCSAEAESRGRYLSTFGEGLKAGGAKP